MKGILRTATFVALALAIAGTAHGRDLLNEATKQVADSAAEKMSAEAKGDLERVAVVKFENDVGNFTELLKAAISKTDYDVILREDAEWANLLAEYERQVRRGDIMDPATVHKLEDQGVDGVVYGTVELARQIPFQTDQEKGTRAEVRVIANLASLNGSLLWSDQVETSVQEAEPLTPSEMLPSWFERNQLYLYCAGGVVVLLLIISMLRRASAPR